VLAPAIIRTFAREDYMKAVWPLRVLLGANVLRMLVTALSGILFVGQGLRALVKIHGTVAVIGLAGGLLVVHRWGVTGVAFALLIAWAAGTVLLYLWFERQTTQSLDWGTYLRYASSAVVTALCAFLATRFVGGPYLQFILGGSAAIVVYVLLLWMQRDLALLGMIRIVRQWTAG
jgi:O-antigen/teichoic acid export membrane protein